MVTQPVFDLRLLENFLERIEHCRIPVVAGIWPLVSVRNAEFMKNELRVSVPDSILERMARAQTPEAARAEGVAIAREMLIAAAQMVQGAQISAPQGRYSSAVDVSGGARDQRASHFSIFFLIRVLKRAEFYPIRSATSGSIAAARRAGM